MKLKLSVLFIGALILASGCARKCPPCPSCSLGSSYSPAAAYSAPVTSGTASYSAPADSASSQYAAAPTARYVSK